MHSDKICISYTNNHLHVSIAKGAFTRILIKHNSLPKLLQIFTAISNGFANAIWTIAIFYQYSCKESWLRYQKRPFYQCAFVGLLCACKQFVLLRPDSKNTAFGPSSRKPPEPLYSASFRTSFNSYPQFLFENILRCDKHLKGHRQVPGERLMSSTTLSVTSVPL
jgi:hypothetical protein